MSHAVDSDGDETPSQPAHTPAASSHAGPQDSAAAPSEVSRGETEAPYSWQAVEGVVRVWAQRWLDFDEQGVESNSALFDSLSRCGRLCFFISLCFADMRIVVLCLLCS